MKRIEFLVQGSAAEPYRTVFRTDGNNLTAYCSCPAGKHGLHCKHRIRILAGQTENIVSGNISDVEIVHSWIKGTDMEQILKDFAEAESRYEIAKDDLGKCKKKLERAFNDGRVRI